MRRLSPHHFPCPQILSVLMHSFSFPALFIDSIDFSGVRHGNFPQIIDSCSPPPEPIFDLALRQVRRRMMRAQQSITAEYLRPCLPVRDSPKSPHPIPPQSYTLIHATR